MEIKSLAEKLLFSTVMLETDKGSGTACIFNLQKDNRNYLFLVTNKHVVSGIDSVRFFFTEANGNAPVIGKRFNVNVEKEASVAWFGSKNSEIDISVMPLVPILEKIKSEKGKDVYFQAIQSEWVPKGGKLESLDAIEDIIFIGYPNCMYDKLNLLPIIRKGITATHYQIDFEGKPIFLIDASIFPGSSGSPVFIFNVGGYSTRGSFAIGSRILFLGIISGVFFREEEGDIKIIDIPSSLVPTTRTKQMIDLGIVVKSNAIVETINDVIASKSD